jgi:hypothetical protein
MATRNNQIIIHCRGRGSGKTTYYIGNTELGVPGIIPVYRDKHPLKSIIVMDTFDADAYRHLPIANSISDITMLTGSTFRIVDPDTSKLWRVLNRNVMNALVIVEDATRFVGTKLTDDQKTIVLDSKQKNIDMFWTFHSLMSIPPDLVRISDTLVLGKTNENFTSYLRNKFPISGLEQGFQEVKTNKNKYFNKTLLIQ